MGEHTELIELLKSHIGANGLSLFDHLCNIFEKMANEKITDPFENFEKVSSFVKLNTFKHREPRTAEEANTEKDYTTELTQWYTECQKALEKLQLEDSKGKKQMIKKLGAVPDMRSQMKILEMAGIYFGEEETYLLQKSLAKLAAETQARELRFWGKILGTKKDYWVAEGLLDHKFSDEPSSPETERHGTGCNRLTYWVCNSVLDEWMQLPLVTPEQIKVSRQIKHLFTGDLEHPVNTYPVFPGKEKNYLKAQIVRITHSNVLVPDGIRKTNDEDEKKEELEFQEETKYPDWETVSNKDNWVHFNQNILKSGRIRHYIPSNVKEEDREAKEEEMLEADPYVTRLQKITEDKLAEEYTKEYENFQFYKNFKKAPEDGEEKPISEWEEKELWSSKTYGDKQLYTTLADEAQTAYCVVAFKNILWPGAIIAASNNDFVNLYVGYGHKLTTQSVDPFQPGVVNDDPEDPDDQPEPNPTSGQPEELESDTDKPPGEDDDDI